MISMQQIQQDNKINNNIRKCVHTRQIFKPSSHLSFAKSQKRQRNITINPNQKIDHTFSSQFVNLSIRNERENKLAVLKARMPLIHLTNITNQLAHHPNTSKNLEAKTFQMTTYIPRRVHSQNHKQQTTIQKLHQYHQNFDEAKKQIVKIHKNSRRKYDYIKPQFKINSPCSLKRRNLSLLCYMGNVKKNEQINQFKAIRYKEIPIEQFIYESQVSERLVTNLSKLQNICRSNDERILI